VHTGWQVDGVSAFFLKKNLVVSDIFCTFAKIFNTYLLIKFKFKC